jgi:small subunit ribosomal protein S6
MRPYEVVMILESSADDASVEGSLKLLKEAVTTRDGTVGQIEKWGRKRFAYELHHRWEGYYTLVEFNAEPSVVAGIDRALTLSDDIVRHKIVRIPDSVAGRPRPAKSEGQAEEANDSIGANS